MYCLDFPNTNSCPLKVNFDDTCYICRRCHKFSFCIKRINELTAVAPHKKFEGRSVLMKAKDNDR